jgi:urease accessory protein
MYAHVQATASGWWGGVLHPVESFDHLITMLIVGVLGGLSVRAGRASWTLPALFVIGLSVGGAVGRRLERTVDLDVLLLGLAIALAVLVFVHPRRTRVIAPLLVFATAVLHGFSHGMSATGVPQSAANVVGFVFTSTLLLSVGAIVGASIGRAMRARQQAADQRAHALVDDRALV